jgi:hypothetical protein
MGRVIVGVDPHKKSVTIEAVDEHGTVLARGRFGTDTAGYRLLVKHVREQWPHHRWAVEGAQGVGRPLAQRLLAQGETVLDVPAKLAARVRVFDTGNARKTDATDAHAIAMVALRTPRLRELAYDEELIALRLLTDRRDELSHRRVQTVNRLQRLLTELIPGGAKRDLSALQAKRLLATVRPRTLVGKTMRRMAAEEITDLVAVDAKLKTIKKELRAAVADRGLAPDGPVRRRSGRSCADPVRRRGCGPVPRPQPLRVLDRHRTAGRILGRADPAPAVAGREPPDEPRHPHRRDRADPPRHRWPRLLPAQARRRQDPDGSAALPEETPLRRRLPPARQRCHAGRRGRRGEPGRALGGVFTIQRGRPVHPGHRLFGSDPRIRRYPPPRSPRTPTRPRLQAHRADAPEPSRWSAQPDERP